MLIAHFARKTPKKVCYPYLILPVFLAKIDPPWILVQHLNNSIQQIASPITTAQCMLFTGTGYLPKRKTPPAPKALCIQYTVYYK